MIANLNEFKDSIDIYEVISNYVALKKSGANYMGCCPFHSEKSGSFSISTSKGIYHCFGCGVGGDSIDFVQRIEKLDFEESCEKIADIIGFTLEYGGSYNSPKIDTSLLEKSKDFFASTLRATTKAKDYFITRGLNEESISKFQLGFCPLSFAYVKTIAEKDIPFGISVGLLAKDLQSQKTYTPFSGRLIFPIYNKKGNVVAFGARILDKESSNQNAKYINSKESKFYSKRQTLYGFHLAKDSIIKKKEALIVEGYMDVIMLHQAGFKNALASCGTALTTEQIATISKLEAKIVLCFDTDNAGQKATLRAIETLIKSGIYDGEVLELKGGKDPCELLATGDSDVIEKGVRTPIIKFMLLHLLSDSKTIESKNIAIIKAKEFLFKIKNEFIRESYIKIASEILNISPTYLRVIEKIQSKPKRFNETEASVVKAVLSKPELIDVVIEWLEFDDFPTLKECIKNLAQDIIDEKAREIALDDSIPLPENIKTSLRAIYEVSSKRKMNAIRHSSLPLEAKLEKIEAIKERLLRWT